MLQSSVPELDRVTQVDEPGQHLASLYALTDRLYRATTAEQVYEAALATICDALGCRRASILLFDGEGVMRFVAWRGLSDTYRNTLEGHTPWKPGESDPEPIFVQDIEETAEPASVKETIQEEGIRALGFVPLVAMGGVIGKFMTYFAAPRQFSQSEIDLSVAIARQLGFAIERMRTEEKLHTSEAKLRYKLENAPVMIWTSNAQGHCEQLNRMLREFWGVEEADVPKFDFATTIHPEDAAEVRRLMVEAMGNRRAVRLKARYRNARGDYRVLETDAQPRVTASGEFQGMIGVNVDTTEREATERALRESEERLRLAAEAARIGTWDLDLSSGHGRWDGTALDIGGLSTTGAGPDYTRESWLALIHEGDRERVRRAFEASLKPGAPAYHVEYRGAVPAEDGGVRWLASHGAVFRDPETGDPLRATGIVRDVTPEKRAQLTLSASEARFRALVAAVPSFVWFAGQDGGLEYLNDRWYEYTGQTPEQALPDGWASVLHPDDAQRTAIAWSESRARGVPYEIECRYRRRDGSYRWYVARAEPLRDADGQVVHWFGTSTDIHERKEAAERIELALDAGAIMGTWVWDVPSDLVTADERFARAFSLDPEECRTGLPIEKAIASIHPADRLRVHHAIEEALAQGGSYRCEYRVRGMDGQSRWVEAIGKVELSSEGTPIRFPGLAIDIEARRAAEYERDRATALLQAFVEAVPGSVYAKGTDGRLMIANRGFAQAIGREPASCLGKTDIELLADTAQAELIMENDRRIMDAGLPEQVEEELTLTDGRKSYWLSTKAPFKDEAGAVVGLVGSSVEITERRQAEERERLLAREVDHRSKNLLGVVQSVVQLTRSDTVEGFKEAVTGRIQALARAHSLLAAGRWDGVDLDQLVREELAPYARGDDRAVISGLPLRLRPGAAQALALTIHELATNAVKYGALSSEAGRVEVRWNVVRVDGRRNLQLGWTEHGGPPAATPTHRGFGSTVIRSSIERQLGGTVNIEWSLHGVRCHLVLPADQLAEGAPLRAGGQPVIAAAASNSTAVAGRRVLVVEDEALISLQIEEALKGLGCSVIGPAASVAEALTLLRQRAPDAAVLDVNLAGERSDQVAQALTALGIPFLYCTGYADVGEVSNALGGGKRLSKPLDPFKLADALQQLI
jgi:PAS domain S-box-containing protein